VTVPDLKLVRFLRGLLVASVLVPLTVFGVVAWESHRELYTAAERLIHRQTAILFEHAAKVLQAQKLVIEQVNDRVRDLSWEEIRTSDQVWNDLRRLAGEVQHIDSIFIVDPQGRSALTTRTRPSPEVDFSDRDYFVAQQQVRDAPFLSGRYTGKISGRPIFNMSMRRETGAPKFDGVVGVSAFIDYFERLYATVAEPKEGAFVSLEQTNGQALASYPGVDGFRPSVLHSLRGKENAEGLTYVGAANADPPRIIGYRKLPDFPAYIVFGMDESVVRASWYRNLLRWGILTALAAAALSLATWFALGRAQKEAAAVMQWQRLQADLVQEVELRQQAEAALLQSQKLEALGQLTTGVAHDFRNLLQVLKGHLGIAKARASEDRVRRAISTCESAVERSEKLIQHLLAFARRQPLEFEIVDLNERVSAMLETLQQVGSNIRIKLELSDDLWPVEADGTQLELALINLVANARDAMPDGGVVEITAANRTLVLGEAEQEGDFVALSVKDHGVGIGADLVRRVWEPFFTTKGAGKGTGLGLATVYGFAKQSRGFATVQSELGQGTVVTIYLPKGAGLRPRTEPAMEFADGDVILPFTRRDP
jgi:two-component system, NtrC family, sensor kinase